MNPLRRMSVHSKMLISFVVVTLFAIGVVFWIGYVNARASLRSAAESQLVGMQRSKANVLRAMLTATKNQVVALSTMSAATEGARNLIAGYRSIQPRDVTPEMRTAVHDFYEKEFTPALVAKAGINPAARGFDPTSDAGVYLQYHYVVHGPRPYGTAPSIALTDADQSAYARVISTLHKVYQRRLPLLGFEQMLIVDRDSMDVIYSYLPSAILGTNLESGPHASSNVAEAARRLRASQDEDDYRVVDMEAHWPALGAAKGWVGTPIFDGSRFVAILLIRFPIEPIEAALNGNRDWEAEGLGKTGEVYLVGPDLTLRTNSRFFLEDKEAFLADLQRSRLTARTLETIRRFDSTALFLPVTGATVQAAFRGEHGVAEVDDYRGVPVLSAYGPLDLDSLRWAVLAERDMSELQEPLRAYARKGLATAAGLALVSSLMAMWLSSRLTRPISQLATAARRVSQGDMSVAVETFPEGEYRALGEAFNEMVASLRTNREALDRQAKENERLLVSLLPASGAAQMRDGNAEARQAFADVTVAFVNLVGFEELAHEEGDGKSMDLLSEIVASCDEAAEAHGVEKVRTIGSSYLAVSGLSVERPDHTERMVAFAREVVRIVKLFNAARGTKLVAEIGINAGPVVGGLVGRRQFIYDVWGDTVKLARGIESDGHTSIMVTRAVHDRVRDLMPFDPPTTVEVRGMGSVELFSLTEEAMA